MAARKDFKKASARRKGVLLGVAALAAAGGGYAVTHQDAPPAAPTRAVSPQEFEKMVTAPSYTETFSSAAAGQKTNTQNKGADPLDALDANSSNEQIGQALICSLGGPGACNPLIMAARIR